MSEERTPSLGVPATRLTSLAAILAVLVGVMVLVGWVFDIVAFKSILPGWFPMKANFAVALILIGIALLLIVHPLATSNPQRSVFFSLLARFCVLLAGLIGVLTLGEYILGWNFGFDQWLFREPAGAVGTSHPGRMAQDAALCLVLLATALLISGGSRKSRWAIRVSVILGMLVATIGLTAMLSHLTPGLGDYGWFGFSIMAMHAGMILVILGGTVIAISWQPDVLQWSLSRHTTAAFACGVVLLVFIGFNTSRSQVLMKDINRKIAYHEEVRLNIRNLLVEVIDAQANIHVYVITGDGQFKTRYLAAKTNSNEYLDSLHHLMADNPHHQQLARIEASVNAEFQWFQQAIVAERTGMSNAARDKMVVRSGDLLDNLRSTFEQTRIDNLQDVEQLNRELESASRLSYLTIAIGTLASLIIFLTGIFRLNFAVIERKRTEGEYRTLIQTSLDGFWINDFSGRLLDVNEAYCQMLGYTREELLRMSIPDIEVTEAPEETAVHIQKIIHTGNDLFQTRHRRKDGAVIDMEVNVQYNAELGERFFAFFRDITGRKLAIDELRESESRFRQIANSLPQLIWTCEPDGPCDFLSKKWVAFTGIPEAQQLGFGWLEQLHPDDKAPTVAAWQAAASSGTDFHAEFRIRRHDGEYRWFDTQAVRLLNEEGLNVKWFGSNTDITERKQTEVSLLESKRRLDEAQKIGQLGFLDWNLITNEIELSDETLRIYGLDSVKNKIELAEITKLVHPDDADLAIKSLNIAIEGRGKHEIEHRIVRPDGQVIYVHTNAEVYRDANEKPIRVLGTIQDITKRKHAELEIHQLNIELDERVRLRTAELEIANKELEAFAYSVSHDLRAPLRAIDGFSRKVVMNYGDKLDDEGQRLLLVVRESAQRMGVLIDDLLSFSRMSRREMGFRSIDMRGMVNSIVDELRTAEAQRIIEFNILPLPYAWGDVDMLRQVWVNLLSNAVKFTRLRPIAHIDIGGRVQGKEVLYWVKDDGAGFDMQYANKLFGVFQRLHRQDEFEGTGVGLAIAQRILLRHNGRIWGEGKPDGGAIFQFSLALNEN